MSDLPASFHLGHHSARWPMEHYEDLFGFQRTRRSYGDVNDPIAATLGTGSVLRVNGIILLFPWLIESIRRQMDVAAVRADSGRSFTYLGLRRCLARHSRARYMDLMSKSHKLRSQWKLREEDPKRQRNVDQVLLCKRSECPRGIWTSTLSPLQALAETARQPGKQT